jgi:hypothetical protein
MIAGDMAMPEGDDDRVAGEESMRTKVNRVAPDFCAASHPADMR